jgi:AsmA protein
MKIVLWVIGAMAAGFLLLCVAVAMLFDTVDFSGRISAEVEQSTHRKLDIGEIHVGIFPTLGARIKNLKLANAAGFGSEPMAEVGEAQVGLRILPLLLHRRVEISAITLKDLRLNLLRQADGTSNWDDFNSPQPAQPAAPASSPVQPQPAPQPALHPGPNGHNGSHEGSPIEFAGIGRIDIDNANISYVDQKAKSSFVLTKFGLGTGAIAPGKPFDFKLGFGVALADPALEAQVQASATFDVDGAKQLFDMQNLAVSVSVSGQSVPGGKQDLQLSGGLHCDGRQGSFKLSQGKLVLDNMTADVSFEGSGVDGADKHLLGTINIAAFNPREALKALGLEVPQTADSTALQQASLSATLDGGQDRVQLNDVVLKLDQSTLNGSIGIAESEGAPLHFALKLDQIDADRYLAPARRNPLAAQPTSKPGEGDNAPLPLDKPLDLDAAGTLDIGKLKLKNLNLANAHSKISVVHGGQETVELNASLYGGTLASTTRLSRGARPSLAEALKLEAVNAGPLLQDLTGKDTISGNGSLTLDVTTAGRSVNEMKRGLNGSGAFALQNGAVKGFNLGQIIRQAESFSGGQAAQQGAAQQTDFTTASASGKFSNGVFHSEDLAAASPLLRLSGAGDLDIGANTIDYLAKPTLVNTAGGQGGKDLTQLHGLVIPVHITGPINAPHCKIDVAAALQQEAVQKLTQKLGVHNSGDLVNAIQGLFGKKKQQ